MDIEKLANAISGLAIIGVIVLTFLVAVLHDIVSRLKKLEKWREENDSSL